MDSIDTVPLSNVGDRICNLREAHGLTQTEFAKELGISQAAVARMEAGSKLPSVVLLLKIVALTNASTDYLLTGRYRSYFDVESLAPKQRRSLADFHAFLVEKGKDKSHLLS